MVPALSYPGATGAGCRFQAAMMQCAAITVAGAGGGGLELVGIQGPIVEVKILGAAASVMTVRVDVSQKLREKFPTIAAVKLV